VIRGEQGKGEPANKVFQTSCEAPCFKVEGKLWPDFCVLSLEGELCLASVERLDEAFARIEPDKPSHILVDLAGLTFMDVTGLRRLLNAEHLATEQGVSLVLTHGQDNVQRLFSLTDTENSFNFADSGAEDQISDRVRAYRRVTKQLDGLSSVLSESEADWIRDAADRLVLCQSTDNAWFGSETVKLALDLVDSGRVSQGGVDALLDDLFRCGPAL
jgi:anti-sigma B factor antagonist